MRKLLNTLYITNPESYLTRDGDNIVVKVDNKSIFRIPIHNLEGVVCFGYMGASPQLMRLCTDNNVGLSFLSPYGKFLARISGRVKGNVLLRRTQYRMADDLSSSLIIAKSCIIGKVFNSTRILERMMYDHGDIISIEKVRTVDEILIGSLQSIENCSNTDSLRGIEGTCARSYFDVFDNLILQQKEDFYFHERSRRPPLDNMNSLLSFLYTLLVHDTESALETVGLDPYVGFFHTDRPGRPGLALDLMEEFRPYLVDRLVLNLVNLKQIKGKDFVKQEGGGIFITDSGRKDILEAWQKRKQEIIMHPFLKEKVPIGLIPFIQALLLARFIRGDINGYPPFFMN